MVKSVGRRSLPKLQKQFKQQRQQCRLKNNLLFNIRISWEFRFIHFVYSVRNIPNVKFRKKLASKSSLTLKNAERGYFTLLFQCDFL